MTNLFKILTAAGGVVVLSTLGCETAADRSHREEMQRQQHAASKIRREKEREEAQIRAKTQAEATKLEYAKHRESLTQNWSKLKAGMTKQEVQQTIGWIDCGVFRMSRQIGEVTINSERYDSAFWILLFINGKLEEWKRN